MMSGCVSLVFLFDPVITAEQLAAINALRVGQKYLDKEAAMEVNYSIFKPELTEGIT